MAQASSKAIVMQDGRTVVFGSRMKSKKEVISENEIRFDFDNGKSLVFDTRKVSPETLRNLALHGGKQKIGDEGSDADTTEAYEAECRAMVDRLYAGTAFERQGGSGFQDSVLIEALLEVTTQTREEIIATLKGMSTAEKLVVRQVAEVADAIDRINAKRTAGVDTEAVAAKFGLK